MAPTPAERIDVLGRRVRWLDRYRRVLSVLFAIAMWIVISRELAAMFGGEWPNPISMIVSILGAIGVWWLIEVVFAWTIALWETEHDRLTRERGLPRAELLRDRGTRRK